MTGNTLGKRIMFLSCSEIDVNYYMKEISYFMEVERWKVTNREVRFWGKGKIRGERKENITGLMFYRDRMKDIKIDWTHRIVRFRTERKICEVKNADEEFMRAIR